MGFGKTYDSHKLEKKIKPYKARMRKIMQKEKC